jgi:hypothetical protein
MSQVFLSKYSLRSEYFQVSKVELQGQRRQKMYRHPRCSCSFTLEQNGTIVYDFPLWKEMALHFSKYVVFRQCLGIATKLINILHFCFCDPSGGMMPTRWDSWEHHAHN